MKRIELLNEDEAAAMLRKSKATLVDWRYKRRGPPWTKIGRTPMYRLDLLEAWLERETQAPQGLTLSSPPPAAGQ